MAESTRLEPPVSGFTEAAIQQAIAQERRRCVGLVLSEFGVCKLAGAEGCARILDALANRMEHPELEEAEV